MSVKEPILEVDIAIVGAGPTGLTLANLLGGMGISVALIERNLTTVQEPRAVSIDDESMRALQAAGLAEAVEQIVARGYGSRYLSPAHNLFLTVEPTSRDYGFDKRNAFQQPELEAVMRRGLARHCTVIQLFGWEMQSFAQTDRAVSLEIADTSGAERTVTARYMVASDGGRSPTRGKLGIPLTGSTFAERWLIVDLVRTENRFRHTEVYCDPARPCIRYRDRITSAVTNSCCTPVRMRRPPRTKLSCAICWPVSVRTATVNSAACGSTRSTPDSPNVGGTAVFSWQAMRRI